MTVPPSGAESSNTHNFQLPATGSPMNALNEVPYDRWREFDPEDTMRFYALRLHEVGVIQSSPNALLAEGTAPKPASAA